MRFKTLRARLLIVCFSVITLTLYGEKYYWRLPDYLFRAEPECLHQVGPVNDICGIVRAVSPVFGVMQWVFFLVLLLAVFPWVARWILAPVRDLVPVIEKVGPQNLGYRVRPPGGRDELTALGRALDDMMDRIAAGYDGQRRFAANASHELRTPLALQRMLIEVGMSAPLTAEQSALLTSQLLQANDRNERMVEGLLVLSQADQGLVAHTPQRLDEITIAMVAANRDIADEAQVELSGDLTPRVVQGDRVLLERLVRNLVHNAVKYNHPGGTVHITVGSSPALTIVNTGPPVPIEGVARLFEPFTRLSSDRLDHSGGSGLGLAIARSVVQAHGGTITVEPGDLGGLRVAVDLPAS